MSSVYTEGEEKCPVCGSRDTGFDLECRTNEQELDCRKCGFSAHTRIVERGGKKFWEVSQQFPIGEGGVVRRPAGSVIDYGAGRPDCECIEPEICPVCSPEDFNSDGTVRQ
jgi:hypothetical protein